MLRWVIKVPRGHLGMLDQMERRVPRDLTVDRLDPKVLKEIRDLKEPREPKA